MMGLENAGLIEKIELGNSFKADEKIIYPVIRILHYQDSYFETKSLTPIALIVKEDNEKYLIPLQEEEISEEFLDLVGP